MNNLHKKILIVASPWLGGSGTVAIEIAENLAKQNYRVHFLSYALPFRQDSLKEKIKFHKVTSYAYSLFPFPLNELSLVEEIVKIVEKEKIDIIHAHYGVLFGHASVLAKQILKCLGKRVKVVITLHGTDVLGTNVKKPGQEVLLYLNKWILKEADVITLASDSLHKHVKDIYQTRRKIHLVANFFDEEIFNAKDAHRTKPVIIHVSNFRKVKQPLLVAKVFKEIVKEVHHASLKFVGDGPELQGVKTYVKKNKVPHVHFITSQKDKTAIANLYKMAHILFLPSLYENFSLSAIEAQACGVPVVASNVGGIPQMIKHNKTGFLADAQDTKKHVKNIHSLLTNPLMWKRMSDNAIHHSAQFEAGKILKQYMNIYKNI